MLKTEAKLATLIRRVVGRRARVKVGSPDATLLRKKFTKPCVFVSVNQVVDTTEKSTGSVFTGRRIEQQDKLRQIREERPARASVLVDVFSDDYAETQAYRQRLLGEVLTFLDSVKVLQLSEPKFDHVQITFNDIVASLKAFSIDTIDAEKDTLYCGRLHFDLNGFVHVMILRK